MSYEHEYTSMSIRVPKSFREKYNKTKDFWKDLGDFFVSLAGYVSQKDLEQLRKENPQVFTFIEEVLPE